MINLNLVKIFVVIINVWVVISFIGRLGYVVIVELEEGNMLMYRCILKNR